MTEQGKTPKPLPCPMCGCGAPVPHAGIEVNLATGEFHCLECHGVFLRAWIEEMIARWQEVLDWLDEMPG